MAHLVMINPLDYIQFKPGGNLRGSGFQLLKTRKISKPKKFLFPGLLGKKSRK